MDLEKANGPLARAFERELTRHYGRIGETENALGYHRGHFKRLFREQLPIRLDLVLRALDYLGVDPGDFFGKAYDIALEPEHLLSLHQRPGRAHPVLRKIKKMARRLEAGRLPEPEPVPARGFSRRLDEMIGSGVAYQRRYLRRTLSFRQPAFVAEYLERLDALRYSEAKVVVKVVETVALDLLPNVAAERRELLGFMCKAIGVYGSASRQLADFDTAAAAIGFALRLAKRNGLKLERGKLLWRAAYVLRDNGEFDRALLLLKDAQIIFSDEREPQGIGQTLVVRGIMFGHKEDHRRAMRLFLDALELLPKDRRALEHWRRAAFNGITIAFRKLGDLAAAQRWLTEAVSLVGDDETVTLGKLLWEAGMLAHETGDSETAEAKLVRAREILTESENPIQGAMVSLDYARVLLDQSKMSDLCSVCAQMIPLLKPFKRNSLAEGALLKFIRAGMAGRVTIELIEDTSTKIVEGAPACRHAPPGS